MYIDIFTCLLSSFFNMEISRIAQNYYCRLFLGSCLASNIKHSSLKSLSQMSSDSSLVSGVQPLAFIGQKEGFIACHWLVVGGGHTSKL
jgi:hypothetical protein